MRILRVADVPRSAEGGMAGAMLHGGAALENLGHDVDYAFRDDLGVLPRRSPARRLVAPILVVRHVARRIREGHPYDLVEVHEPLAAAYCAARSIRSLPPCVVLSHGLEARYWLAQRERWSLQGTRPNLKSRITVPATLLSQAHYALRHADHVVVLNTDDHDHLIGNLHIPPGRVSRVDNGAPTLGLPERQKKRGRVTLRLLFFGSWIDRKGAPELVRAATALQDRDVDFTLTLAGIGQDADRVAPRFPSPVRRRIEVRSRIARSEIANLLAAHDVLIAPSWYEGMPLTVLEAAAAGLALVLTDISGHRQILDAAEANRRDRSAILLQPHEPYGLVKAVLSLAEDANLLLELQTNARRLANKLSWDNVGLQLEAAYSRALFDSGDR